MVVFALVNSVKDGGGYYIASSRTSMGWRGLPHDLAREMEVVRHKGEEVWGVSVGLDGDWFLRTNARYSCKTEYDNANTKASTVELFAQHIHETGLSLDQYDIQSFTFMPTQKGYVTVVHKVDGSLTRCLWYNVPPGLNAVLEREGVNGVRHVAVGMNGAYVVLLNTGAMRWAGVPDPLHQLLVDAENRRRGVVTVSLSLIWGSWYFIEFADGVTAFFLSNDWHDSINKFTAQASGFQAPQMSTSYNQWPSPSPLHQAPQQHQGQYGLFNPTDLYSRPYPSYTPFIANPCLAAAFAAMPQPAPMYPLYRDNITNVYNTLILQPQQQQTTSSPVRQAINGFFRLVTNNGTFLNMAVSTVLAPVLGFGGFGGFGGLGLSC